MFKPLATLDWWLHKAWGLKIVILAGLFSGAEMLLQMGILLPGSASIPVWARGLLYVGVVAGAFILRYLAMSKSKVMDEGNQP